MKPCNFPGRKVRRQIDAEMRKSGVSRPYSDIEYQRMDDARNVRTKKFRGN